MEHHVLAEALRQCSPSLFSEFCRYAACRIESNDLDMPRIAMLVIAMRDLSATHESYSIKLEQNVLLPAISNWPRQDFAELVDTVDRFAPNSRRSVELWHRKNSKRWWPRLG